MDFYSRFYNFFNIATELNVPLLGVPESLLDLPFMAYYIDNYKKIDILINGTRGYYTFTVNIDSHSTNFQYYQKYVDAFLHLRKNAYQRIYDALNISYKPLFNYDKKEHITFKKTGTESENMSYGTDVTIDKMGDIKRTDTFGPHTESVTQKEATFDNSNFNNKTQNLTETPEIINTSVSDSVQNESTRNPRTDNKALSFTDRVDDTTIETSGNIGVTTSQQMLESEVNLWSRMSTLYEQIFSDIIKEFFYLKGSDCFYVDYV